MPIINLGKSNYLTPYSHHNLSVILLSTSIKNGNLQIGHVIKSGGLNRYLCVLLQALGSMCMSSRKRNLAKCQNTYATQFKEVRQYEMLQVQLGINRSRSCTNFWRNNFMVIGNLEYQHCIYDNVIHKVSRAQPRKIYGRRATLTEYLEAEHCQGDPIFKKVLS